MRRYHSFIADNARWDGFEHRDDDIVIATPAKCGTTWLQNIVGMLVFDRVELPAPMAEISPWLDMLTHSRDDVFDLLGSQRHRRFIKTHTPFDGLPMDDRVTYLTSVRHPLQVIRSMDDHNANIDMDRAVEVREGAVGLEDLADLPPTPERSDDPRERLLQIIDDDTDYGGAGGTVSLKAFVHHVQTIWADRHRPNVHLFHYSDLRRDRRGQMERVATILDASPDPDVFDAMVEAAGFEAMKSRASVLAPDTESAIWRSTSDFFRSSADRTWDDVGEDVIAHFHDRLHALAGSDLADWMCNGDAMTTEAREGA